MRDLDTVFLIISFLCTHSAIAQDVVTTIIRTAAPVIITATPSSTSPSPQYTDSSELKSAVLNSTNTYRNQHNASALTWNETLASYATSEVSPCEFAHSNGPYGENLAQGYPNITAAIDAWGGEREEYDFVKGLFSAATGHFTQLVWKNTTSTGCGVKDCEESGWLLFCEYSPAGNVMGQFKQAVQDQIPEREGTNTDSDASETQSGSESKDSRAGGDENMRKYIERIRAKLGDAGRLNVDRFAITGASMAMILGAIL